MSSSPCVQHAPPILSSHIVLSQYRRRMTIVVYLTQFSRLGCWLLVVGCWLLVAGCWSLVIGCWLLVVGRWLLVVGRWSFVVGCWLLAPVSQVQISPSAPCYENSIRNLYLFKVRDWDLRWYKTAVKLYFSVSYRRWGEPPSEQNGRKYQRL